MSLRARLSPELRIALRLAHALQQRSEREPKSLRAKITDSILVPVFAGIIGFAVGLGTNYYQAKFQSEGNMKIWHAQHDIEIRAKLLSTRVELLASFQEAITKYFEYDTETGIESNFNVFKAAAKIAVPDFDINSLKNILTFPTPDQVKEGNENWSRLQTLAQSIEVYFGDKIGSEAHALLNTLNTEPIRMLDLQFAVDQLTMMRKTGNLNINSIDTFLGPYVTPVPHSVPLEKALDVLGLDMKCLIRRNAEIELDLISNSCSK